MASAVIMPRQGQSVESCLIGKWYKQKGDKVSVGDILFTYETDKATFEEESKVDGVMLEMFFEEGDDVECLVNVCVIGNEGESTDEFRPVKDRGTVPVSPVTPVSPRAKRLADRTHADLRYAAPTGAGGRIVQRDVRAVLSQGYRNAGSFTVDNSQQTAAEAVDYSKQYGDSAEIIELTKVRKIIAKSMHASLSGSAQLTSHSSFDATDVLAYRKELKASPEADGKPVPTITDIIVFAASRILPKHKYINAHFLGESMAFFNDTHIGVAVDTPRGLLVPTVFNANKMSLTELSIHTKELIEKCKKGSAPPDLLKGASFTVSNLGGFGIEMFTPILNPPQTGILGVCNIIERLKDGKPYPALGLSLTYDHRAMDGADSARFLKDLIEYLENFTSNADSGDK